MLDASFNPFMTEADIIEKFVSISVSFYKSMNWFLYDIGLRHERVKDAIRLSFWYKSFTQFTFLIHFSNCSNWNWSEINYNPDMELLLNITQFGTKFSGWLEWLFCNKSLSLSLSCSQSWFLTYYSVSFYIFRMPVANTFANS